MTEAILQGKISGLWIMGENPALSDPNMDHVRQALGKLDFLVVQDIFLTETAEFADVVLPAASFAEKNGTFTNTERRVQRIRKAVRPPGKARDDLSIINTITSHMQFDNPAVSSRGYSNYRQGLKGDSTVIHPTAEEIFTEIGRAWPAMAGINYERLEHHSLQWPCPAVDHPGTPGLFTDGFPRGRARFTPVVWKGPRELPDAEYPFVLSTGRVLYQYHTGSMSRRSSVLEEADQGPHVEINPADAERLGINDGDIVRAASRRGQITLPAMVTDRVNTGIVFIPFHYKEAAANLLTNDALDPDSKIPEAKVCAVQISRESTNIV
jgi:predicted molibdopterin-dependent oxidoreductase YjgC